MFPNIGAIPDQNHSTSTLVCEGGRSPKFVNAADGAIAIAAFSLGFLRDYRIVRLLRKSQPYSRCKTC